MVPAGLGGAVWQRVGLPHPGGLGDQEARLMDALELLHAVHDRVLQKDLQAAAARAKADGDRRRRD